MYTRQQVLSQLYLTTKHLKSSEPIAKPVIMTRIDRLLEALYELNKAEAEKKTSTVS